MTKFLPRRFGEYKEHANLAQLLDSDLRAGDLLIAKEWTNHALDVAFVRTGQALFSHVRGGSSQSEHVLLNCLDGGPFTVEALSKGLRVADRVFRRDHVVYGCTNHALRTEAVRVAEALSGVNTITPDNIADYDDADMIEAKTAAAFELHYEAKKSVVKYRSGPGMAASVFRLKRQGRSAERRLVRLYDVVYGGKSAAGVKMVCSEFVASCYEVAALRLELTTGTNPLPFGLGVDPRAMTAKALEAVLQRGNTCFRLAGRYRGTCPNTDEGITDEHRTARVMAGLYVLACQELGRNVSPDDAYQYLTTHPLMKAQTLVGLPSTLNAFRSGVALAYRHNMLAVQ